MIDFNKTLAEFGVEPYDFYDFMGLAIWPVRDEFKDEPEAWGTHFIQCEPEQAEFWGLYGICTSGEHMHLRDYPTEREAFRMAGAILPYHSRLFLRGIILNY